MKFNLSFGALQLLLVLTIAPVFRSFLGTDTLQAQSNSKLFPMIRRSNLTTVSALRKSSQDTLCNRLDSVITSIFADFFSTAKFISQQGQSGASGKNKLSRSFVSEVLLERGFIFSDSGKAIASYEVSVGKDAAYGRFQIYFDAAFSAPKKYFSWRQLDSLTEITLTTYPSQIKGTTPVHHKILLDSYGAGLYETKRGSEKPVVFYWNDNGGITEKPFSKLLLSPLKEK